MNAILLPSKPSKNRGLRSEDRRPASNRPQRAIKSFLRALLQISTPPLFEVRHG
jgi:hypothetical protein